MTKQFEKIIGSFHRKVAAIANTGELVPTFPDVFVRLDRPDVAAATAYRQTLPPHGVMIYVFTAEDQNDEEMFSAVPGAPKNLFIAAGPKMFHLDRLSMAITLIRHRHVHFTAAPEVKDNMPAETCHIKRTIQTAIHNYRFTLETRFPSLCEMLENLPVMYLKQQVRLSGGQPSCPAVICGAGPSLKSAYPLLRQYRKQLFIIAVGHAFKALMQAEIVPDMVVEIDNISWYNWRHDYIADIPLLAAVNTAAAVTSRFQRLIWNMSSNLNHELNAIAKATGLELSHLTVSRTVTVTALDFAVQHQFPYITLLGNDLALGPDGETHADTQGTITAGLELFPVPGNLTAQVMTSHDFFQLKTVIENYLSSQCARQAKSRIFNSTDGGAKIEHLKHIQLEKFCAAYTNDAPVPEFIPISNKPATEMPERLLASCCEYTRIAEGITDFSALMKSELNRNQPSPELLDQIQSMLKKEAKNEHMLHEAQPFSPLLQLLSAAADDILERQKQPCDSEDTPQKHLHALFLRFNLLNRLLAEITERLEQANAIIARGEIPPHYNSEGMMSSFYRSYAIQYIKNENPELAGLLVREDLLPEFEFETAPTHYNAPLVKIRMEDGSLQSLSYPLEAGGMASKAVEDFLNKHNFNPGTDGIVLVAPGDWQHAVILGERFRSNLHLLVVEPIPDLLKELIGRGLFLDRLPPHTPIIAASKFLPNWRKNYDRRIRQWRRENRRILYFVNPLAGQLTEVRRLMAQLT